MATQKFMGRNELIKRLSAQVGSEAQATEILKKRGDMYSNGKLTPKGEARNRMTAEERAKDRAAKATGKPTSAFTYNPRTNTAKVRK